MIMMIIWMLVQGNMLSFITAAQETKYSMVGCVIMSKRERDTFKNDVLTAKVDAALWI